MSDDEREATVCTPDDRVVIFNELKVILESENDADELLRALAKAEIVNVDRALLTQTQMGLAVANLKSHLNVAVSSKSRELVARWRSVVTSQKDNKETPGAQGAPSGQNRKRAHDAAFSTTVSVDAKFEGPFTKDEKRNKCREFLFRAFLEGIGDEQRNMLDVANVCKLVGSIEEALHEYHCEKHNRPRDYNNQLRAIKSNLADKRNPEFNARIYLGAITAEYLASMASTEMASDAKKRERQKAKKDALEACQSDWDLRNVKRAKGQFPCGKCKSENTAYFQMQTRSSDEPMTTYVNCLNCSNRWKF